MPKISIIIPVYNTEQYLKKCIDSMINQTLKDIEIIIINDGSTDNSKKIIESYDDKRIKFIDKNNSGIGSTRNLGIDISKGEYISFIDSDDYIKDDFCEKMYNKAVNDNCDIVICDYYEDKGKLEHIKFDSFEDTSLEKNPQLINNVNLGPCNKIYKKELFKKKKNRFVENLKYEDVPLVCKLLSEAKKIGKIDEPLKYYVIHGNSQTTVRDDRMFDIFKIVDILINDLSKYEYLDEPLLNLLVMILTDYTIQQRYIKEAKARSEFIDITFNYLNKYDINWRKCDYLKRFPLLKRFIKTNKLLTKTYCFVYTKLFL